jgi:CRP-like cAMP-binding protein
VVLYGVGRNTLRQLLEKRPAIAEELAQHLAQRMARLSGAGGAAARATSLQPGILARLVEQLAMTLRPAR